MKTLEQLGISPAPWDVDNHNNIRTSDGHTLAATIVSNAYGLDKTENNALIIAAAPELYDAGRKTEAVLTRLFKLDEFAALLKSGAAGALIACRDELRNALAKAAGESEVKE